MLFIRSWEDMECHADKYSSIILSKNSQHYVRRGDVERLVQQGYLQILS